jgi:hypothetical protein
LRADGDDEVLNRGVGAGQAAPEHTHGFEVRILMLESEFILERSGETRRYSPGKVFEVPANAPHAESFCPSGAATWWDGGTIPARPEPGMGRRSAGLSRPRDQGYACAPRRRLDDEADAPGPVGATGCATTPATIRYAANPGAEHAALVD